MSDSRIRADLARLVGKLRHLNGVLAATLSDIGGAADVYHVGSPLTRAADRLAEHGNLNARPIGVVEAVGHDVVVRGYEDLLEETVAIAAVPKVQSVVMQDALGNICDSLWGYQNARDRHGQPTDAALAELIRRAPHLARSALLGPATQAKALGVAAMFSIQGLEVIAGHTANLRDLVHKLTPVSGDEAHQALHAAERAFQLGAGRLRKLTRSVGYSPPPAAPIPANKTPTSRVLQMQEAGRLAAQHITPATLIGELGALRDLRGLLKAQERPEQMDNVVTAAARDVMEGAKHLLAAAPGLRALPGQDIHGLSQRSLELIDGAYATAVRSA